MIPHRHPARYTRQTARLHLIEGAGHWVQQEQPVAAAAELLNFLGTLPS